MNVVKRELLHLRMDGQSAGSFFWNGHEPGARRGRQDVFLASLAFGQPGALPVAPAQPAVKPAKHLHEAHDTVLLTQAIHKAIQVLSMPSAALSSRRQPTRYSRILSSFWLV